MKKLGTMDKILILIGSFLLVFTGVMIWLFWKYQTIPDTLVTCVFGATAGECGIMGWIKTCKVKNEFEINQIVEGDNDRDPL